MTAAALPTTFVIQGRAVGFPIEVRDATMANAVYTGGVDDRAQIIVESASSPICTIDGNGTITWAGGSIDELLGWPAEELVGRNLGEFLEPASLDRAVAALGRFRSVGQSSGSWRASGLLVELLRADGAAESGAATGEDQTPEVTSSAGSASVTSTPRRARSMARSVKMSLISPR